MVNKKHLRDLVAKAREDEAIVLLLHELEKPDQKGNAVAVKGLIHELTIISNNLKSLVAEVSLYDFEKLNQKKNRNLSQLLSLIDRVFDVIPQDQEDHLDELGKKEFILERFPFSDEAFRQITETCLIAADIDKTILEQNEEIEEEQFKKEIAPLLIEALQLHTHLSLVTGNSMHQLCDRFFKWLIYAIHESGGDINLLARVHFFCNSGGVYAHFSTDLLRTFLQKKDLTLDKVYEKLTVRKDEKVAFVPEAIQSDYINRTRIPEKDKHALVEILEKVISEVSEAIDKPEKAPNSELQKYDLTSIAKDKPRIDLRSVEDINNQESTIQITLKPVPSYHYAKKDSDVNHKNDYRSRIVAKIRSILDQKGFNNYDVRPGGRTSIDITLDKLDKAYALEYLIDKLNIQGSKRLKEGKGAHTIYLGDEVIVGGGNDYPVTRIPGLLVFAVNENKGYVPLHSRVIVPYANLSGPEVVKKVLQAYNFGAKMLLRKFDKGEPLIIGKSAIDALKKNYFLTRLKNKIDAWDLTNATNREVQILHAIVTLMCREDFSSRGWISILVNELDSIMELIDESKDFQAIGTSYDET